MQRFLLILWVIAVFSCAASFAHQTNEDACGILNERYLYNFNGTAAADEFPWIGRVYYLKNDGSEGRHFRCQAVLISRRHLLIGAQCIIHKPDKYFDSYAVILGYDNQCYQNGTCPSSVPNYYEIDEIAIHPNVTFDNSKRFIMSNNIAILTLKLDVTFNTEVRPICLPTDAESNAHYVGQYLQYAGYAKNFVKPLKAVAHVASMARCRDFYVNESFDDVNMCVFPDMKEKATFFAGGPLMGVTVKNFPPHPHSFFLIGLVGFGTNIYVPGAPDVVVGILPYIKWIRENIA